MAAHLLSLKTQTETQLFAKQVAKYAGPGRSILLSGDIGAGKTFFARALIQSILGHDEDVPSPTFTLIQVYETPKFDIWHCDLYRLTAADQADELGLEEAFETAFCLIEWPDRLENLVPQNTLRMDFYVNQSDETRTVTCSWDDEIWGEMLDEICGS